jgi:hypothetical protein
MVNFLTRSLTNSPQFEYVPVYALRFEVDASAWGFKEQVIKSKWFKSNRLNTSNQLGNGLYLSMKLEATSL